MKPNDFKPSDHLPPVCRKPKTKPKENGTFRHEKFAETSRSFFAETFLPKRPIPNRIKALGVCVVLFCDECVATHRRDRVLEAINTQNLQDKYQFSDLEAKFEKN